MKTDGSFEQVAADKNAVEEAINWLKEQDVCIVVSWNDAPMTSSYTSQTSLNWKWLIPIPV